MVEGLSKDLDTYTMNDGTVLELKNNVPSDIFFKINDEFAALEDLPAKTIKELYLRDKEELQVAKKIFGAYFKIDFKQLSKKYEWRELSRIAGEVFIFLGRGINKSELSKSKKHSQDMNDTD